jgi:DNA replicative helicase MCM subunit Mcm2 (Cdc46/Mcm family)
MSSQPTQQQLEARIDELETRIATLEGQQNESRQPTIHTVPIIDDTVEVVTGSDTKCSTIRQTAIETIEHFESAYGEAPPTDYVVEELTEQGHDTAAVRNLLDDLRRKGTIYEPKTDHVRVV